MPILICLYFLIYFFPTPNAKEPYDSMLRLKAQLYFDFDTVLVVIMLILYINIISYTNRLVFMRKVFSDKLF
jgi:hypothetical protein